MQWLVLLLGLFLLVGMWIGWECWGRPLKRHQRDIDSAGRYRLACRDVMTWCCEDDLKAARMTARQIMACGEGEGLNAGTPIGDEACQVHGLREQLRQLSRVPPNVRAKGRP